MEKKIAFFHTTLNTPLPMKQAFERRFPGVQLITVADDSVLPEINANSGMFTARIVRKLIRFAQEAKEAGAVAVVCMCTTLASAVAQARPLVDIPFLTIDGPMLDQAVRTGDRVALLLTAKTTLEASSQSLARAARAAGRENIRLDTIWVAGAFEKLNQDHDKASHDRMIVEAAIQAAQDHDVIALGQASMVDAAKELTGLGIPVLTSVNSGIEQLAAYLE